jgi:hypothetical protein
MIPFRYRSSLNRRAGLRESTDKLRSRWRAGKFGLEGMSPSNVIADTGQGALEACPHIRSGGCLRPVNNSIGTLLVSTYYVLVSPVRTGLSLFH